MNFAAKILRNRNHCPTLEKNVEKRLKEEFLAITGMFKINYNVTFCEIYSLSDTFICRIGTRFESELLLEAYSDKKSLDACISREIKKLGDVNYFLDHLAEHLERHV